MKKIFFILIVIIIITGGWFFWKSSNHPSVSEKNNSLVTQVAEYRTSLQAIDNRETSIIVEKPSEVVAQAVAVDKFIKLDAPFILQAPFANWSEFIFENACEEASLVMAMNWISGEKSVSPEKAKKQILEIVAFENKEFGYNTDTDVFDMKIIFQKYFKYQNVFTQENISVQDIKNELQEGNLVIVPAFGRALKNPNYTGRGPIVHMLTIIGYDPKTKEFITHDPGTRKGAGYRYNEDILFSAIWSYPNGKDTPDVPTGKMKKVMLVVKK